LSCFGFGFGGFEAAQPPQAPSVVVSYTGNPDVKSGKAFAAIGVQIAAGVPLRVSRLQAFF
jgi:hypothetical protein